MLKSSNFAYETVTIKQSTSVSPFIKTRCLCPYVTSRCSWSLSPVFSARPSLKRFWSLWLSLTRSIWTVCISWASSWASQTGSKTTRKNSAHLRAKTTTHTERLRIQTRWDSKIWSLLPWLHRTCKKKNCYVGRICHPVVWQSSDVFISMTSVLFDRLWKQQSVSSEYEWGRVPWGWHHGQQLHVLPARSEPAAR